MTSKVDLDSTCPFDGCNNNIQMTHYREKSCDIHRCNKYGCRDVIVSVELFYCFRHNTCKYKKCSKESSIHNFCPVHKCSECDSSIEKNKTVCTIHKNKTETKNKTKSKN
jgi:hypothetical protein